MAKIEVENLLVREQRRLYYVEEVNQFRVFAHAEDALRMFDYTKRDRMLLITNVLF